MPCSGPSANSSPRPGALNASHQPGERPTMADTLVHQPPAASQKAPYYLPQGTERELFELASRNRLPLLLKGPTCCGKTRLVAHMAHRLGLPLHTVACHDDLT